MLSGGAVGFQCSFDFDRFADALPPPLLRDLGLPGFDLVRVSDAFLSPSTSRDWSFLFVPDGVFLFVSSPVADSSVFDAASTSFVLVLARFCSRQSSQKSESKEPTQYTTKLKNWEICQCKQNIRPNYTPCKEQYKRQFPIHGSTVQIAGVLVC